MSQPFLFRLIDKAVFDYNLISDGDNILIAASGGKDSTALVEYFANRAKRPGCNFSFRAVHVETEITNALSEPLLNIFSSWNVPCENIKIDVLSRLKEGRKMNCYWCSTQRRTELLRYAQNCGFNKIALGHHLDDILETLLMNMLGKGELSTMPPVLAYKKYPVTVIRPLCYALEETIVEHAEKSGYISQTCSCGFQENSLRKTARKKLEALTDGSPLKKKNLFLALKHRFPEYLP